MKKKVLAIMLVAVSIIFERYKYCKWARVSGGILI